MIASHIIRGNSEESGQAEAVEFYFKYFLVRDILNMKLILCKEYTQYKKVTVEVTDYDSRYFYSFTYFWSEIHSVLWHAKK